MSITPPLELIADRTRLRLLRALGQREGASLADLAADAGVHVNTARGHLRELERAGLVDRSAGSIEGRGRPAARYRLAEGWRLPATDMLGLAELLAATVLRVSPDARQLEAVGRDWGRYLIGRPGSHQLASEISRAMAQLGFDARLEGRKVVLSGCPCPLVMPRRPELLCRLATGVLEGMLDATGGELQLAEAKHDPRHRLCTARVRPTKRRAAASAR